MGYKIYNTYSIYKCRINKVSSWLPRHTRRAENGRDVRRE